MLKKELKALVVSKLVILEVIMLPAQLESAVLVESGVLREGAGSQKAESPWSFWYICRCGFEW